MTGDAAGGYVSERRNPLVRSTKGGRVASALVLPFWTLRPPTGYGVLTTTGRRSGKKRRKCVRAIRDGGTVYLVAIPGTQAAWLHNIRAHPRVRLRMPGGTYPGVAHEPSDPLPARQAYCAVITAGDYLSCLMHRRGFPTRTKIAELLRTGAMRAPYWRSTSRNGDPEVPGSARAHSARRAVGVRASARVQRRVDGVQQCRPRTGVHEVRDVHVQPHEPTSARGTRHPLHEGEAAQLLGARRAARQAVHPGAPHVPGARIVHAARVGAQLEPVPA